MDSTNIIIELILDSYVVPDISYESMINVKYSNCTIQYHTETRLPCESKLLLNKLKQCLGQRTLFIT